MKAEKRVKKKTLPRFKFRTSGKVQIPLLSLVGSLALASQTNGSLIYEVEPTEHTSCAALQIVRRRRNKPIRDNAKGWP